MHLELYDEALIPVWAIPAIECGDYSGLTGDEEMAVRDFVSKLPAGAVLEYDGQPYFTWENDIMGPIGDEVETANIYTFHE